MRTSIDREEKPELLIIDTKKLRQAGIARLLQAWADVMGFTVNAVLPDALPDSNNYAMTIVNLGDTSIEDAQCHVLLENVRRLVSNAFLIFATRNALVEEHSMRPRVPLNNEPAADRLIA